MVAISERTRHELSGIRDTVQSIWVAILLALVLRAFMVEAFVIPTGSMAPRLMGAHWDLVCPACGYEYAFGGPRFTTPAQEARFRRTGPHIPQNTRCPNCGEPYSDGRVYLAGGDRVLVLKYLYHFVPPKPFDVVVFRNPQNNRENYIKRLIGLPGETIEIVHGDLFVSDTPDGPRRIRRKPPVAQSAMWQTIFDNDYVPAVDADSYRDVPAPRWVASDADCWKTDAAGRRFVYTGGPTPGELIFQAAPRVFEPHYGYNTAEAEGMVDPKVDVCTDLKLSVEFIPAEPEATLQLALSSFDDDFRGEVAADGTMSLSYRKHGEAAEAWETLAAVRRPGLQPGRAYEVALANVDFSVRLILDGRTVLEITDGYPQDYESLLARVGRARQEPIPTPRVRLAAAGGVCELRHLRLMRDVYYTGQSLAPLPAGPLGDYARELKRRGLIAPPSGRRNGWGTTGHPITLAKHEDNPDLDEFFVLGDNSPQSLDGRGWTWAAPTLRLYADAETREPLYQLGTVPRYNLIGKAFFVYWPAGFRPPGLPGLPIVPNVGKMRFVR